MNIGVWIYVDYKKDFTKMTHTISFIGNVLE